MTSSFSYLEPVCCSMSSSNLTCIQVSQEAGSISFRIFHSLLRFPVYSSVFQMFWNWEYWFQCFGKLPYTLPTFLPAFILFSALVSLTSLHRQCNTRVWKHFLKLFWDLFSGDPVKTLPSNAGGASLISGWGAKIPHVSLPKNQDIKLKQYCNKFTKRF